MKKIIYSVTIVFTLFLAGCSSTQTLQEYYVDNSENPNFLSLDLPASLLNLEKAALTPDQKSAITSLKKLNILAFKKTTTNASAYISEKATIKAILKNDKYEELMKVNTSFGKGTISYLGEDDAIDEVIVYGDSDDKGFMLVRILGDNMNPANLMAVIQAMEKSDFNGEQLKQLGAFFN